MSLSATLLPVYTEMQEKPGTFSACFIEIQQEWTQSWPLLLPTALVSHFLPDFCCYISINCM